MTTTINESGPGAEALAVAESIAAYLGDSNVDVDEHKIGMIHTCVRIIGAREPGSDGYAADLVLDATSSLHDWLGDYGVRMSPGSVWLEA
jgi:hypothetical protein